MRKSLKLLLGFFSFVFITVVLLYLAIIMSKVETVELPKESVDWDSLQRDISVVSKGEFQFKLRCVECHGMRGQGSKMAPSLIDSDSIYGNDPDSIMNIIFNGSPTRLMKGWGAKLQFQDIKALTAYLMTIQGTDKP